MTNRRLLAFAAAGLATTLAGCGATNDSASSPQQVVAALRAKGWHVATVSGMPHTVTGARQVAYLQTTSPAGTPIDLQFFATDAQARGEATAATKKLAGFHASAIGDLIAFSHGDGRRQLSPAQLTALRSALP